MADQYAKRDIMALDKQAGHYWRHVNAMTAEGLHSKSDIAAELAYRDARIAQLEHERDAYRTAEEAQIALRQKADEREAALWETLAKIADDLGIDCQSARGRDGKPSDVYIEHINRLKTLAQANELANCCDLLTDKGYIDAAIYIHDLSQERRRQAEAHQ